MKKSLLIASLLLIPALANAGLDSPKKVKPVVDDIDKIMELKSKFVNPIYYWISPQLDKRLAEYIEGNVEFQTRALAIKDRKVIDILEGKELSSFYALTEATNKDLLETLIIDICKVGVCDYAAIQIAYNNQNK